MDTSSSNTTPTPFSLSGATTADDDLEGRVEVTVQRLDGVAWVGGSSSSKNKNGKRNLPLLTATVSFSGSAQDMQIGSSTICGLTGQLLVESDPIHLDPSFQPTDPSIISPDPLVSPEQAKDSVWLTAEWPEQNVNTTMPTPQMGGDGNNMPAPQMGGDGNNNNNTSSNHARTVSATSDECTTSTTTLSSQPHVRMHFPGAEVDPRIPKPCLSQSNRGSKIVHHHQHNHNHSHHHHHNHASGMKVNKNCSSSNGGLETTETCSTTIVTDSTSISAHDEEPLSLSSSSQQPQSRFTGMENVETTDNAADNAPIHFVRGESAFWSHSGDAMPEILELYIRLRCHDASTDLHLSPTFLEGVSFLVLFGQEDDCGCHVIDLPVRRPFLSVDPAESENDLYFGGPGGAASSPDTPRLLLTSQARLRLKVTIVPDKRRAARDNNKRHNINNHLSSSIPMTTSILDNTNAASPHNALDSPVEVCLTRSTLEAKLKPLMDKIRENELLALEQWQAQKRAMDVHVPMMLNNSTQWEERNVKNSYYYYPARSPHYYGADGKNSKNDPNQHNDTTCGRGLNDHVLGDVTWSWDRIANIMTLPCCGSCDGPFTHVFVDPAEEYDEDSGGILRGPRGGGGGPLEIDTAHFRDDNSTIATRDSWGI